MAIIIKGHDVSEYTDKFLIVVYGKDGYVLDRVWVDRYDIYRLKKDGNGSVWDQNKEALKILCQLEEVEK